MVTALADPDIGGSHWRQGKTLMVFINLHCKAVVFWRLEQVMKHNLLSQKVLSRVEAKVWVEGNTHWTTFFFFLPKLNQINVALSQQIESLGEKSWHTRLGCLWRCQRGTLHTWIRREGLTTKWPYVTTLDEKMLNQSKNNILKNLTNILQVCNSFASLSL